MHLLALRVWASENLQFSDLQKTLLWAGVIGVIGGFSSVLFLDFIAFLNQCFTGHSAGIVESFEGLTKWRRLVIPAIGGVLAGATILLGRRLGQSRHTTDYMEAVVLGDGLLSARSSLTKCVSAAFSIASGGSIGREGPIVQLSALLASLSGRLRGWSAPRRRMIVACGAAAGIASAYNAPLAGALFVAEIVLGSISMDTMGPLVVSSVLATQVVRHFHGSMPLYDIPLFELRSTWELSLYLLLGIVAGLAAPLFLSSLRWSEKAFDRLNLPLYWKLGIGGLIVGALAIWYPQVCGNGYSVVVGILNQKWPWTALAILCLMKMLATCATFGSGAVGGVFTPTLFTGACLGYLFGGLLQLFGHGAVPTPGGFALVGMGAFLAAATHAPIMAILIVFELTLDYQIILPLMLGCVVAFYVSNAICRNSIYSESLQRKKAQERREPMGSLKAADLMRPGPAHIREDSRFSEIAHVFIMNDIKYLFVTDKENRFKGAVALHDIKPYLTMPELANLVIAKEIARADIPTLTRSTTLDEAMNLFVRHGGERLPVVENAENPLLIGSVSKMDVILAMAQITNSDALNHEEAP